MCNVSGVDPRVGNDTLIKLKVHNHRDDVKDAAHDAWYAYVSNPSQSGVTVAVHPASNAIVGAYRLAVSLLTKDEHKHDVKCVERVAEEFILLFNPWCKGQFVIN